MRKPCLALLLYEEKGDVRSPSTNSIAEERMYTVYNEVETENVVDVTAMQVRCQGNCIEVRLAAFYAIKRCNLMQRLSGDAFPRVARRGHQELE